MPPPSPNGPDLVRIECIHVGIYVHFCASLKNITVWFFT